MKLKHLFIITALAAIIFIFKFVHGYQIIDTRDVIMENVLIGQINTVKLTCVYCGKSEIYQTLYLGYAPDHICKNWIQPFSLEGKLQDYHIKCWNTCLKKIVKIKTWKDAKYKDTKYREPEKTK